MPRTKRPRKKPSNDSMETKLDPNIVIKQEPLDSPAEEMETEDEKLPDVQFHVEKMEKLVANMVLDIKSRSSKLCQTVNNKLDLLNDKLPKDLQSCSIGDLLKGTTSPVSENSLSVSQHPGASDMNSTTRSLAGPVLTEPSSSELNNSDKFKTPTVCQPTPRYATITPKVGPNSPVTILRRPKLGEVIVSMRGSPVMPNAAREDKPTFNIPMPDGAVMCLLPERGVHKMDLQHNVGEETKRQIKIILENLSEIVKDNF